MPFLYKPVNEEPTPPTDPLPGFHRSYTLTHYPPALVFLGTDVSQLETDSVTQSLLKSFKPSNTEPT